jgi:drug/metabolite transporter (DMT)-like permease
MTWLFALKIALWPMSASTIGILYKIVSTFAFVFMGVFVREIAERIPTGEIVFFRTFLALVPLYVWFIYKGEWRSVHVTQHPQRHFYRCINSVIGMSLGFLALKYIPLTDQVALGYAAPLLTIPFAVLILKEVVRMYRWSAVLFGLCGVMVILYPYLSFSSEHAKLGAIIGFSASISYALGAVIVRSLATKETMAATVFYFCIFCGCFSLLSLPFGWVMPTVWESFCLLCIGITGGIGQILLTQSYKYADTSLIAPFEYVSIIWASLFGFIIFGDVPTLFTLAGTVIVVLSGLFVIYRERQLGLKNPENL